MCVFFREEEMCTTTVRSKVEKKGVLCNCSPFSKWVAGAGRFI